MVQHRFLHPFKVAGIVDMTHEVDVGGIDADGILMGNRVTHINVNIILAPVALGGCNFERQCCAALRNFPPASPAYAALQQMALTWAG